MRISADNHNMSFDAKFINNNAFSDVVCYAVKNGKLKELDSALNTINNANPGDILIVHGKISAGTFSNFTYFVNKLSTIRRSVQNLTLGATSPEESSYNAIIDLATLGRKFRKLVGSNVKENISPSSIFDKYTVSK